MAFVLYRGPAGGESTIRAERFLADGAVTKDMPVKLTAGASGGALGKVAVIAGASDSADVMFGVAQNTAADGEEVSVIPAMPGCEWIADAAADTNVSNVAAANYLATTTLLLTVGAATVKGQKCNIKGVLGATGARKYIVSFYQANVVGV